MKGLVGRCAILHNLISVHFAREWSKRGQIPWCNTVTYIHDLLKKLFLKIKTLNRTALLVFSIFWFGEMGVNNGERFAESICILAFSGERTNDKPVM